MFDVVKTSTANSGISFVKQVPLALTILMIQLNPFIVTRFAWDFLEVRDPLTMSLMQDKFLPFFSHTHTH